MLRGISILIVLVYLYDRITNFLVMANYSIELIPNLAILSYCIGSEQFENK